MASRGAKARTPISAAGRGPVARQRSAGALACGGGGLSLRRPAGGPASHAMAERRHAGARAIRTCTGPGTADRTAAGAAGPCRPPGARSARGHRRAAPVCRGGLAMNGLPLRTVQGGFTLVEVLVALGIVAIALMA